jgi:hypothetical protein
LATIARPHTWAHFCFGEQYLLQGSLLGSLDSAQAWSRMRGPSAMKGAFTGSVPPRNFDSQFQICIAMARFWESPCPSRWHWGQHILSILLCLFYSRLRPTVILPWLRGVSCGYLLLLEFLVCSLSAAHGFLTCMPSAASRLYICKFMYIYICIYIHIYVHMYICIYNSISKSCVGKGS